MILQKHKLDNSSRSDLEGFYKALKGLPWGNYEVYICAEKPTRSERQRKYYFGVIVHILSEHTGYSKWEMNEQLKDYFNPKNIKDINGRWKTIGGSIEAEKRTKCEEIFERIRQWAFDTLNVVIPLPEKVPNEMYVKLANEE